VSQSGEVGRDIAASGVAAGVPPYTCLLKCERGAMEGSTAFGAAGLLTRLSADVSGRRETSTLSGGGRRRRGPLPAAV
jgi:hypothetical protein